MHDCTCGQGPARCDREGFPPCDPRRGMGFPFSREGFPPCDPRPGMGFPFGWERPPFDPRGCHCQGRPFERFPGPHHHFGPRPGGPFGSHFGPCRHHHHDPRQSGPFRGRCGRHEHGPFGRHNHGPHHGPFCGHFDPREDFDSRHNHDFRHGPFGGPFRPYDDPRQERPCGGHSSHCCGHHNAEENKE